jgi:hypothetical protein
MLEWAGSTHRCASYARQPPQGDATGRLQELDGLKVQGVVNDAEYAAQRQRILDSI